jgi:hypothetical protein
MSSEVSFVILLVAVAGAFAVLWAKVRAVERKVEQGAKALADVQRVLQTECLPALTESSRRVTTVLDRLDAERAAAESEISKAREGLVPLIEELAKASHQLGDVRVELGRLIERAGQKAAEETTARAGDGAWMRELVRTHLIGLGIGSVSLDGVVAKADGSHVVRARGLRGDELWTGNVVVRGGKVESAASVAARMFP